jgi:GH15 family glucan-1,4-alpha-glucosidase
VDAGFLQLVRYGILSADDPLVVESLRAVDAILKMDNRFDVYYGMADRRIGVARLDVPTSLPPGGIADPPEARV